MWAHVPELPPGLHTCTDSMAPVGPAVVHVRFPRAHLSVRGKCGPGIFRSHGARGAHGVGPAWGGARASYARGQTNVRIFCARRQWRGHLLCNSDPLSPAYHGVIDKATNPTKLSAAEEVYHER
ncbi:hypothetical protein GUJ93_ZPchr0006g44872 [Zizania palustris]|uniref:Uncharacterized protein n=1 Tax=Zizania palustris TaxID=103762 RepID=A0A8J5SRH6_ZIZPA|nr:hypothetical protein GUJ93_ZPchr0006g44872 [Zizania palustris]